jgi:virginiamycin B lyase
VVGPDGALWFTESRANAIGRITPHGDITEYLIGGGPNRGLGHIMLGSDGNLWFTENAGDKIGRVHVRGK